MRSTLVQSRFSGLMQPTWSTALALALALAAVTTPWLTTPARAADIPTTTSKPAADKLASARALVKQQQWAEAQAELKRVNDSTSADWHNLMGFALRKGAPPDLAGAEQHYNEALRIDPNHRGALEYSGELYLMQNDLARAEQRLATLDKVCRLPCEEYTDLKKSIAKFKAAR